MTQFLFTALLEGDENGFGVIFPDVPGCFSAGDTVEDAWLNAQEALEFHIASLLEEGLPPPGPRPMLEIETPEDFRETARLLVAIVLPDNPQSPINKETQSR